MRKTNYPPPANANLSVIIPAYNAEDWISSTLEKLSISLAKSNWHSVEIIIVDDGSTDKTVRVIKNLKTGLNIKIVEQKNTGRFLARKAGVEVAKGDYILFIDTRVFAKPNSFSFLTHEMNSHPEAVVWNGHIEIDRQGNRAARFWYVVTFIAWRRYMANPRRITYNLRQLEQYPKGTTAFFGPRKIVTSAYKNFSTNLKDLRFANDDTALITLIAEQADLNMDPQFAFTYHYARSSFKAFTKHTFHRGIVFIDGFMRKESRYYLLIQLYLIAVPFAMAMFIIWPLTLLLIIPTLVAIFLTTLALGVQLQDAWTFTYVLPVFAIVYTAGLYKGVFLKLK